jgi:hypothetical protein
MRFLAPVIPRYTSLDRVNAHPVAVSTHLNIIRCATAWQFADKAGAQAAVGPSGNFPGGSSLQAFTDEAFKDLLKKRKQPVGLKAALKESVQARGKRR